MNKDECQHESGRSIGDSDKDKNAYKKYAISRSQAAGTDCHIWELFVCNDCGCVIDENTYRAVDRLELAAWIDDLLTMQRENIRAYIDGLS